MNSAPKDFSRLCRLLALKRHEQPPPGYFDQFPRRVLARLEAAGSADCPSWFGRLLQAFELKPVLAGGFGVSAFGLLFLGLVAFQQFEETPVSIGVADNGSRTTNPTENGELVLNQFPNGDVLQSSINPAISTQPASGLFPGFHLNVQAASFSGGN